MGNSSWRGAHNSRGPAAQLLSTIEAKIDTIFVRFFKAEREFYPATILCRTLDRIHHFTSFPEHIDFVAHLKRDLDVLNEFQRSVGNRVGRRLFTSTGWAKTTSPFVLPVVTTAMREWRTGDSIRQEDVPPWPSSATDMKELIIVL